MNHNSVFEQLADNVYGICGCNGVGVAKGTYLGYYMAEMDRLAKAGRKG